MNVKLQYGRKGLRVDLASSDVCVLEPAFVPGFPDEKEAFLDALRRPIASAPLKEMIKLSDKVAIVIPDVTRPLPSDRLLPWLFAECEALTPRNVTVVNGTGSHRANTPEELAEMVGADVAGRYRVVNHNAHDPSTMSPVGKTVDGKTVLMNREYVQADKRIILGFIEPHFMAGFSGGYKAVFPGIADIDSIMHYHRASVIGNARSTWGCMEDNPTQEQIRHAGSLLPVDFCINVTLNRERAITGLFCGRTEDAHAEGCRFARETAMAACDRHYPIVITTNGGYPLDQNLYQTVKGMSAAAQIVEPGGLIVAAARCNDGFPAHGNFRGLLFDHTSPEALLETILAPGFSMFDQWEAQLLAMICLKARVGLYSEIPADEVRRAYLMPVDDVAGAVDSELARIGGDAAIAVLPEGPMTIPYVQSV